MALNESPVYGKEYRFGILPEPSFGQSAEGQADICELTCEPVSVNRGVKIREIKGGHGSKDPIYNERAQNISGSMAEWTITQPINGFAGGAQSSNELLALSHFQNQTDGVYSYFDTHPSGDGVAASFTFFIKSPNADRDEIYVGSVCRTFDMTFERGEVTTQTLEIVSKTAGAIDQTIVGNFQQSGSAEQAPIATFEDFTYQIDINGTGDSNVTVKSINVHHGWDDVEGLTSDGAGSHADRGFVGRSGNTFSLTFLRDDQSQLADTAYEKGQSVKLTITAGASLAANWNFTSYFCTGKIESIEYSFDGLAYTTLNCKMLSADEDSNMCELDLS